MTAEISAETIENGLKQINLSGTVAKGFNCTVKAIVKGSAQVVFLADDADAKDYKALITGLCKSKNIKLQTGVSKAVLGGALGLHNLKADSTVRRVQGCGACAIVKFGTHYTPAMEELMGVLGLAPQTE